MNQGYYGPNAYDSTRISQLQLIDNSGFSFTTQKVRNSPLPRYTQGQCREHLSSDMVDLIELLNSPNEKAKKDMSFPGHEMWYWTTLRNPRVLLESITDVLGIATVTTWIGTIIFGIYGVIRQPEYLLLLLLVVFTPTLLYYLGKQILKHDLLKDKNNIFLNRRTGIVTVPRRKNTPAQIPFGEFDAYLGASVNPSGSQGYHLWLGHRYSEIRVSYPAEKSEPWEVNQLWEYWQQYMDISKPLPDTPRMEPFRSRDPVTAAHDTEHRRPADYWKNLEMQKAQEMHDASTKAAKKYPWGLTRDQALAHGWQPSGFGEGNWKKI